MRALMLAHVSDLHLGLPDASRGTESICEVLVKAGVDHVVVTGGSSLARRRRGAFASLPQRRPSSRLAG